MGRQVDFDPTIRAQWTPVMLPADHNRYKGKKYDINEQWLNEVCAGRWTVGRLTVEESYMQKVYDPENRGSIIEVPAKRMTYRYAVFFRAKRDAMLYRLSVDFG
jgi:hypothetical protein